ncbi:unnamed protein product, partial [marine sediment metagenome]
MGSDLDVSILEAYSDKLEDLSPDELILLTRLTRQIGQISEREKCQTSFIEFVKGQWDDFIEGSHHRVMAEAFDRVISGDLKRLIINMA